MPNNKRWKLSITLKLPIKPMDENTMKKHKQLQFAYGIHYSFFVDCACNGE